MARLLAVAPLLASAFVSASAQASNPLPRASGQETAVPKTELAVWGSGTFANGHVFGFAQERKLWLAELRYGRLFFANRRLDFRYVARVTPLALLGDLRTGSSGASQHQWVYGGGLSPLGVQMNLRPGTRLQPFLSSNGGFLYFTQRVLSSQGTQFQFTVDISGGMQVLASSAHSIYLGYRYHHLSNANMYLHNPGLDTHMLFLGFSFLR